MMDFLFSEWTMAGIGAAAIAIAGFFPPFRQAAIAVAVAAAGLLTARHIGRREGAAKKQKEWDDAETRTRRQADEINARARRDVAADPDGMRRDPNNRDNW